MSEVCILSGLEIPRGQRTIEHYVPKSRAPRYIWSNPRNLFPAIKIINNMKGNLLPCEWQDTKLALAHKAYMNWHLRHDDKEIIKAAIENWHRLVFNPCEKCLLRCGR